MLLYFQWDNSSTNNKIYSVLIVLQKIWKVYMLPLYFSVIRCLNISLLICISHTYNPKSSVVTLAIRRLYCLTSVLTSIVNFLNQDILSLICCPSVKKELSRRHLRFSAPFFCSHVRIMLSPICAYWIVPECSAIVPNAIDRIKRFNILSLYKIK